MFPNRSWLLPILLLFCNFCFSQSVSCYKPFICDSLQLVKIKNDGLQKYLKDSASVKGENKKYIVQLYRERYKYLESLFDNNQLIYNAALNDYLMGLITQITDANPQLKNLATRFLFSRSFIPNAFSLGEGTIVFNMGLFYKLSNESQLIFVLCHELAHLYLDHGNKSISQYVNVVYSDDFQQELKDIKKS